MGLLDDVAALQAAAASDEDKRRAAEAENAALVDPLLEPLVAEFHEAALALETFWDRYDRERGFAWHVGLNYRRGEWQHATAVRVFEDGSWIWPQSRLAFSDAHPESMRRDFVNRLSVQRAPFHVDGHPPTHASQRGIVALIDELAHTMAEQARANGSTFDWRGLRPLGMSRQPLPDHWLVMVRTYYSALPNGGGTYALKVFADGRWEGDPHLSGVDLPVLFETIRTGFAAATRKYIHDRPAAER